MAVWSERVVPRLADRTLATPEVMALREVVCEGLAGRVLELGFGSGLNLGCLPTAVTSVDAVEPSDVGWGLSGGRRAGAPVPVDRIGLDGQRLAAADEQYDAALSTFTLCTIPDVERALSEVRRVLVPGGVFHFLERGRSPDDGVRRWQRRMEPLQRRFCGGCHLTRDVPELVRRAGLDPVRLDQRYLPGPAVSRPWTYVSLGVARRPA